MSYDHSRILAGYLKKKGFGGWKTRYCILSETVLYYFKREEDATTTAMQKGEKPDGLLNCLGCGVYKETEPLFAFSVVLTQTKKQAFFQAPTAEDAEAWVRELKRVSGRVVYTLDNPDEFHKATAEADSAVLFHSEGQRAADADAPSVALHYDFDMEQTEAPVCAARPVERASPDRELDRDSDSEAEDESSRSVPANVPLFPSSSPTSSAAATSTSLRSSSSVSSMHASSSSVSLNKAVDSEDEPPPPPPFEPDPELSPQSRRRSLLANAPTKDAPPRSKLAPKSPKVLPANPKIPFTVAPDRPAPRLPDKKPTMAQLERSSSHVATIEEEEPNFITAAKLAGMMKTPRISIHASGSDSDTSLRRHSLPTTLHSRGATLNTVTSTTSAATTDSPMVAPRSDYIAPRRIRPPPSPRLGGSAATTPTHASSPSNHASTEDDPPPPPQESDEEAPPPPALQVELSTSSVGSSSLPSSPNPGLTLSPFPPSISSTSATPSPEAVNIHSKRPSLPNLPKFGGLSPPPPVPSFFGNAPVPAIPPTPILTLHHPRQRSASAIIVAEASEKGLFKQLLAKPPTHARRRSSLRYPDGTFSSTSPPLMSSSTSPKPSPPSHPHHSLPPRTKSGPLPSGPQILPHRMSRSSMVIHIDDRRLSRGSVSRGGGVIAGYCKILKGRLRKKWENRYFTLDYQTRSLLYRESWDSQLPQKHRTISLINAHVSAVERFREHGYCWMIQTPRRSYFICAFTPEDQLEWVRAITLLLNPVPGSEDLPLQEDEEPTPIDIEQFRPSPPATSPLHKRQQQSTESQEEDPIVISWLAWEATQRELEYQRELTLFLLEINQDDFTGRERRQVKFSAGENLMAPKLLYEAPPSQVKGKVSDLKGELSFTSEMAQTLAKHLDAGNLVWLHANGGVLQYSIEGESLAEGGDMLAAYEQKCPPGQNNPNFESVGKQFLQLETTRHTAAQTLLAQSPHEVVFGALLCRHLRRPEEGVRKAALGSSLSWLSTGNAADALFSLQTLFGWLVANGVILSDLCSVWDVVTKGVPSLDVLYNQCFGISVVAGMKHVEDRRFFSHSQRALRVEGGEKKESPPSKRDSVNALIDPTRICFLENGTLVKEAQVAAKISQALQVGLFVVFALTRHRGVEFLVECREEALDLREAWTRWKLPFERVQAHCLAEIFPRLIPAWTAIERSRYDTMVSSVSSLFPQAPVLVLSRFMQQSPDMLKPPVFGDVLLKWLPPASARSNRELACKEEGPPPLTWHANRLMDWLVDNHVVGNYTVQLTSHKKLQLPSYDRMYHQLFLSAPMMYTSLSSAPSSATRPASNATLSSSSVFASVLHSAPPCFSTYLRAPTESETTAAASPSATSTAASNAAASSSLSALNSPSAGSLSPHPSGKLTPRGSFSTPSSTPRSSTYTTPKPGSRARVKKQSVVLSDDSSDSGDEGYENPGERAWAEGCLTSAFAAFPLTEVSMDKEQIMSICIELATDGLQEAETSRFVALLTGGQCPSLGAMLYDFVDKTGGHEPTESEGEEEGDEEEAGSETPVSEAPRTGTLAEF